MSKGENSERYARYKDTYNRYQGRTALVRVDGRVANDLRRITETLGCKIKTVAEAIIRQGLAQLDSEDKLWEWWRDVRQKQQETSDDIVPDGN